jgi:hypothetical protein
LNSGPTPWATPPALFVLGIFEIGSLELFAWVNFNLQSSWSLPLSSRDYRGEPLMPAYSMVFILLFYLSGTSVVEWNLCYKRSLSGSFVVLGLTLVYSLWKEVWIIFCMWLSNFSHSYLRGWGQEGHGLRPANSSWELHLQNNGSKKVGRLLCKSEALSSNPSPTKKTLFSPFNWFCTFVRNYLTVYMHSSTSRPFVLFLYFYLCFHQYHTMLMHLFFCGTGVWIWGLTLYHSSHYASLFCVCWLFSR